MKKVGANGSCGEFVVPFDQILEAARVVSQVALFWWSIRVNEHFVVTKSRCMTVHSPCCALLNYTVYIFLRTYLTVPLLFSPTLLCAFFYFHLDYPAVRLFSLILLCHIFLQAMRSARNARRLQRL